MKSDFYSILVFLHLVSHVYGSNDNTTSTENFETNATISNPRSVVSTSTLAAIIERQAVNVFNSTLKPSALNPGVTVLHVKCGVNQELKTCGTACPMTCSLQNPECEEYCIKDICQCKEGYVVSPNGTCLMPSECPSSEIKACPKNSHIVACGSPCAATCDNRTPTVCSLQCVVDACICDPDHVLNDKKECIPVLDCPPHKICSTNEKLFECGTNCEPTCEKPFPGYCSDKCLENACQCDTGFVRNDGGQCVHLSECPL